MEVKKNILKILAVTILLAGVAAFMMKNNSALKKNAFLERRERGEGRYDAELIYEIPDLKESGRISVRVEEQGLSEEEIKELFLAAQEEIDATFPGENESAQVIRKDVSIAEQYQNGEVRASWSFDSYRYISPEGKVSGEDLPEEGALVKAIVELSCENQKRQYEFYFRIYPPIYTKKEQIQREIEQTVQKQLQETGERGITLPQEIDGKRIQWKQKSDHTAIKILFLGIVTAGCMPFIEKRRREEEQKKRKQIMQMEYPGFVSKLTILLGSGMTLFSAWKRIAENYESRLRNRKVKKNLLYEEVLITCREIESGVGEQRAYERFGDRIALHEYRKLGSILTQNMKKGTAGLLDILEEECRLAFEERKNLAKKYGEEAGTKMLFPMMMMFGMIIAIIMIPAMMSF